jgi:hypothetical protein
MEEQHLLFSIESMLDINPLEGFRILFDNLKADHLDHEYLTGRKPFSRQNLLKAIIFKNLNGLPTLSDLAVALRNNPSAAIRCGFNILKPLPSLKRYSEFLRDSDHAALQKIRIRLIHQLIDRGLIRGNSVYPLIPVRSPLTSKRTTSKQMSKIDLTKSVYHKVIPMLDLASWSPSHSQQKISATSGVTEIMWS